MVTRECLTHPDPRRLQIVVQRWRLEALRGQAAFQVAIPLRPLELALAAGWWEGERGEEEGGRRQRMLQLTTHRGGQPEHCLRSVGAAEEREQSAEQLLVLAHGALASVWAGEALKLVGGECVQNLHQRLRRKPARGRWAGPSRRTVCLHWPEFLWAGENLNKCEKKSNLYYTPKSLLNPPLLSATIRSKVSTKALRGVCPLSP